MQQVPNARAEFFAGCRAFGPMLMSIVPFGMVCGAAAISAGMTPWQAFAMSWVVFAGSAQIAATQLFASGAPLVVIIATAAVVNLRFMMYSASLGPHFRPLKIRWKALFAYLITDQAYALSIVRYMDEKNAGEGRQLHWFYFGLASAIWACWQVATVAGILLGSLVPASWSLDFVVPLTFIAMVVPLLSDRAMLVAALAGGMASVLLVLPLKLNLIAAAMIGIAAGLASEKLRRSK
jgi:predicted branched-subunit amino acid permease